MEKPCATERAPRSEVVDRLGWRERAILYGASAVGSAPIPAVQAEREHPMAVRRSGFHPVGSKN